MKELMKYLPECYRDSPETVVFQSALQPELEGLWEARDDLLAQLDLDTATWGLDLWERALGLEENRLEPQQVRRRLIAAKIRGRGTTTPAAVEAVSETALGIPVKVAEYFSECLVELVLDAGGKVPEGIMQLQELLAGSMPAHLDWYFVIPLPLSLPYSVGTGMRESETRLPQYRKHTALQKAVIPTGRIGAAGRNKEGG